MNAIEKEISKCRALEESIHNEIDDEKIKFAKYLKDNGLQTNVEPKKKTLKEKIKEIIDIIKQ